MIVIRLIATLAFATGVAYAAEEHMPRHGGIVGETKEVEYELVAKADRLVLHVREHNGKPIDVSRATAKLTLLAGTEKQEVEMKPAGSIFEASGSFKVGRGTKVVAVVTIPGKRAGTPRFTLK